MMRRWRSTAAAAARGVARRSVTAVASTIAVATALLAAQSIAAPPAAAQPVAGPTVTLVQVAAIHGPAHLVEVHDSRLYVANENTLTLYDVSKAEAPVKLGSLNLPEKIWGIRVVGPLIYAAADFYGLAVIDASDPKAPVLKGRVKTPGQAKNVAIVGTTGLVADHMSGIDIIDVADPARPVVRDSYFLEGYARDVTSSGSLAFAIDAPAGLYTFDLGKTGPVEPVGSQQSARAPASIELGLDATGRLDLAVLVGGGLLQIYDLAAPAAPVKVATFQTPGTRPVRATLLGRRAIVADGREGVQIVDLSTPAAPALIGGFKTAAPARDVAASSTAVFVAVGTDEEGEILVLAPRR